MKSGRTSTCGDGRVKTEDTPVKAVMSRKRANIEVFINNWSATISLKTAICSKTPSLKKLRSCIKHNERQDAIIYASNKQNVFTVKHKKQIHSLKLRILCGKIGVPDFMAAVVQDQDKCSNIILEMPTLLK